MFPAALVMEQLCSVQSAHLVHRREPAVRAHMEVTGGGDSPVETRSTCNRQWQPGGRSFPRHRPPRGEYLEAGVRRGAGEQATGAPVMTGSQCSHCSHCPHTGKETQP
ncbi:unnamed protein product [Pleuronectes platessa]|uniref:Uncharacterized protein n=1 Tax=Pleuronectes platessa TaxID=8262 RepID=A0A9N7Z8V1_PLEPL|nr:unnamed protein product [Pleuronectes platessa]